MDKAKLEWTIMDNLADDYKCPATICPEVSEQLPDVSRADILESLLELHNGGFVRLQNGGGLNSQALRAEPENNYDTPYWFGLTSEGCARWERESEKYSEEPISWSNFFQEHIDCDSMTGFIQGLSKDACVSHLPEVYYPGAAWEIIMDSVKHSEISGFQAKYYKYLSGGHRIDFKVRRKD